MTDFNQPQQNFQQTRLPLPNATAVLVLGILCIPGCCCYGFVGIILAIIALFLAAKDRRLFASNPDMYEIKSYNNLNTGRICAIIGLSLSIAMLLFYAVMIAMFGWDTLQNPDALREALEQMQNN